MISISIWQSRLPTRKCINMGRYVKRNILTKHLKTMTTNRLILKNMKNGYVMFVTEMNPRLKNGIVCGGSMCLKMDPNT